MRAMLTTLLLTTLTPTYVPPGPPAGAPPELQQALEQADAMYEVRDGDSAMKSVDTLRAAAKVWPQSADVQWRIARALSWIAEGNHAAKEHQAWAREGWDAGKRAVQLAPSLMEAHYFLALCVGEYANGVGVVTALREGLEAKFRDPLLLVEKTQPGIDWGGVYAALGRYKYELPWPMRDLSSSIAYFRKGPKVNPDNVRIKVYLAESLDARDGKGDAEEARRLLDDALKPVANPYDPPEETRTRAMAKVARARIR